ncbi:MAG TPA: TlpA disulfide reductase family protein [Candidatus Limnocylindria bacterium]|nr:TlpA disulfide reductase family protein [Candidatus Limnocylindria bacterium]
MRILGRASLIAGLVLVSCGTTNAGGPVARNEAPDRHEAAATAAPAAARVAALTMRTTDGKDIAIPTTGHPTIVYFMAAWCVSCVQGAVNLAQIYQDYGSRGLQVIAIDVDTGETPADLDRFRSLAGNPRYFWAMDAGQRAARAYAVRSLDATILVSGSGEILFRSESLPDPNTLRRAVQKALGQ